MPASIVQIHGRLAIIALVFSLATAAAEISGPALTIRDGKFALDGKGVFLLGCSYYGALGIDDDRFLHQDLDELRRVGFNWVRVWATWRFDEFDMSAVAHDGSARAPFMERLKRICEMAGQRGMVVDVTVSRGNAPFPPTHPDHVAVMTALATALKPYRNVYFDVANERDIGDARYVSKEEVAELVRTVKRIDAMRICTASCVPNAENVAELIESTDIDFIAPHLSRTPRSPGETAPYCREILNAMRASGHIVPVLLQEPFRRGYVDWQPNAEDFRIDLTGAVDGGAAGWCFHNGATRGVESSRPRRSFDMRSGEGRLFAQIDDEEKRFFETLGNLNIQRAARTK